MSYIDKASIDQIITRKFSFQVSTVNNSFQIKPYSLPAAENFISLAHSIAPPGPGDQSRPA